jgi:hypothetical protein
MTTMPNAEPACASPASTVFDAPQDTLRLRWSRVQGAARYQVSISSPRSSFDTFADSSLDILGSQDNSDGDPVFVAGLIHRVAISAVDPAYYAYFRRSSDPFAGIGAISNLTGALGVFGSLVVIDCRTLAVR